MSKSVCALVHRPGSTREAFQAYYEDAHAPLAVGLFPFTGYVRNHLDPACAFGWDTISEFWSADMARTAALLDGPVGETMRADEERFMDRARIAPGGAEELAISAGEPADAQQRRTAVLLSATAPDGFRTAARTWAEMLGARHGGVSLDFVTAWQTPAFPADAVVWLPGWAEVPACPAGLTAHVLRVRRFATPPAELLGTGAGRV